MARLAASALPVASSAELRAEMAWEPSMVVSRLPRTVTSGRGARQVVGYPALVDEGDTVAVRVHDEVEATVNLNVVPA